jgi:hypothetical protein
MPKIKTKFTAQFTAKLGKTPVVINVPVDFTSTSVDDADSLAEVLADDAAQELQNMQENAILKLANKADLKRAFKAYAKANPPPSDEASA